MGSAESEFSWVSQFPCPGLWGSPFCASSPGQGSAVSPLPPFSSRGAKGRSCTCLCGSDLSVAGSSASAGSVQGCVFVYEHVIVLVWFDGCGCDSAGGLLGASVGVCLRFSEPVCRGGVPKCLWGCVEVVRAFCQGLDGQGPLLWGPPDPALLPIFPSQQFPSPSNRGTPVSRWSRRQSRCVCERRVVLAGGGSLALFPAHRRPPEGLPPPAHPLSL